MEERIQFGEHGLLVLAFDSEAGYHEDDSAQGEKQQLRLGLEQHRRHGASDCQDEPADDDRPVLQQDAGHRFGASHQDDDNEGEGHRHKEARDGADGDRQGAEQCPYLPGGLPYQIVRDGGIPFVQLPTTLLAAVDASVGGKTAVNLEHGKNLAGLFHQPLAVICDTDTLKTLSPHEIQDGSAEAIKHGILDDTALFDIYEHGSPADCYEEIIVRSVIYKSKIVTEDPNEKGVRKLLNLGHTAAHAIERLSNFSISHGHAVAIGTAIVTRASVKRGLLDAAEGTRILRTLQRAELPVVCPFGAAEMAKIAALDKKAANTSITVILPEAVGRCRMEKMPISALAALFADGREGQA